MVRRINCSRFENKSVLTLKESLFKIRVLTLIAEKRRTLGCKNDKPRAQRPRACQNCRKTVRDGMDTVGE